MYTENGAWIGTSDKPVFLEPSMANRHGLITGATGTGKTTTLKVMAESFSAMGVPVFLADVKGDLSGISQVGIESEKITARLEKLGVTGFEYMSFPTRFWDIFGEKGHPVRVTISDMGPVLLSRLLNLSDVQAGVLNLVFHIADEQGLLLIDLKDLRSMLSYCADHKAEFTTDYGNMSPQSIGAIQRSLLTLEQQGGDVFFGEPALDINDWIMTDDNGLGFINILNANKLINSPLLYSTFLLWMLSELFEKLPEEGDLDIPKMVFFFDEAHLLFNDAPKALLDKVTQIVKLIRSKGVGVYFISQSPADIPDSVLSQLQNRVQHALRAYTPAEQKAVKVAAQTFRANPAFSTEEVISTMGVGEALLSFLDKEGVPGVVEKCKILPPQSLMAPAEDSIVEAIIAESEMEELYREAFDRESAYEILVAEAEAEEAAIAAEEEAARAQAEAAVRAKEEEKQRALMEKQRIAAQKELDKIKAKEEKEAAARAKALEKEMAAERRQREKEAAAAERERRKLEAAMIRELTKAVGSGVRNSTRSTASGTRKTTTRKPATTTRTTTTTTKKSGGTTTRTTKTTTTTRNTRTTPRKTTTVTPTVEQQLTGLGIELGKGIVRGLFGTRR